MAWGKTGGKFRKPEGSTETLEPTPDRFGAVVFPYRGIEQHGVEADRGPVLPSEEWVVDPAAAADLLKERPDVEPTPVRIVQESSKEIQDWRSGQTVLTANPSLVAGRNKRRSTVRIKNLSATVAIYVGNTVGVSTVSGYPIAANGELQINSEEEVYGISADGSSVGVAVIQELSVG